LVSLHAFESYSVVLVCKLECGISL
jgi:hypothetical protein